MNSLLHIGLMNALSAAVLAVGAAAASKLFRRPPLTRALWLLVLFKLITPPIWSVPFWHTDAASRPQASEATTPIANTDAQEGFDDEDALQMPDQNPPLSTTPNPVLSQSRTSTALWPAIISSVWLAGSCAFAAAILISSLRIHRLIRQSIPASARFHRRVQALAQAMGLSCVPKVHFLDRPLPPMLCALGTSPRILLPVPLWQRLDERQQDTVLSHELAHLRRHDHWVRALELLVSSMYWWNPVVWWARRELREAAEQCCDAWVLWTMPRLARNYAAALIEAIEYISSAPAAVPALASGMGQFTDLRRRLVMIKQGNVMRSLTRPALAAVCGAAGLLLPLSPTLGQSAPEAPNAPIAVAPAAPAARPDAVATALDPTVPVAIEEAPAPQKVARDEDPTDDRGGRDRAELQKARAEIQALRAQLRAAERRMSEMERAQRNAERASRNADRQSNAGRPEPSPAPMPEYGAKPRTLPPVPSYGPAAKTFSRTQDDTFPRASEKFRAAGQQTNDEAFARAGEKLRAAGQQLDDARDRTRQTVERRLDQMERQLTNMVGQLRQMKQQLSDQSTDRPSPERK